MEGLFHFVGTRLKDVEQISMTSLEVFKYVGELLRGGLGIKLKHPVDDMVRSGPVGGIKIAWFSRRLERSDDDSSRIRPQI